MIYGFIVWFMIYDFIAWFMIYDFIVLWIMILLSDYD